MKYLIAILVALVTLQASVCAEEFDLTKLSRATVTNGVQTPKIAECLSGLCNAQPGVDGVVSVTPWTRIPQDSDGVYRTPAAKALNCSSGTCVLADGVGDGNNAVAKKEAVVAAPTRRWGITGYKRVGWFRRTPIYGWTSTPSQVRSTGSCASGSCSTGRR